MQSRLRLVRLVAAFGVVAVLLTTMFTWLAVRSRVDETQVWLARAADSRVALLAALHAADDEVAPPDSDRLREAALDALRDEDAPRGFGDTGEYVLGVEGIDRIDFISAGGRSDSTEMDGLAALVREAVAGRSGTTDGVDFGGRRVLAAWRPVPGARAGLVATIDRAEVIRDLMPATGLAALVALLVALGGAVTLWRLGEPTPTRVDGRPGTPDGPGPDGGSDPGTEAAPADRRVLESALLDLDHRSRLTRIFLDRGLDDALFPDLLQVFRKASGAGAGTIGYISDDGALIVPSTMSAELLGPSRGANEARRFPREEWGDQLWCHALREHRVRYSRGRDAVPRPGARHTDQIVAIPIVERREAIGIVYLEGPASILDAGDIERLQGLVDHVAPMLGARLLQERLERARTEAEAELARQARRLEESNADLEQFAYVASHDLQEPLRMVASFTQLLAERYGGRMGDDADDFIHYIVDGAKRMQAMVNGLLRYSRAGRAEIRADTVDLNEAVRQVLDDLGDAIATAGGRVHVSDLPVVVGDVTELRRVLQNLLSNAMRYGGEAPPEIHIGASVDGDEACVFVRDHGIGIPPERLQDVFLPFRRFTSRHAEAGSGLGLAICRRIVDRHGGRIWVESEPGLGSTFYFTLPLSLIPSETT